MPATKTEFEFQEPVVIKLSDAERITGQMTEENVAIAVLAFHRDGLVVLENAVDTEHCDKLNGIMSDEIEELIQNPKTHFNDNTNAPAEQRSGNMRQRPPLKPELMFEDIWANKPAATVLNAVLGPKPRCNFVDCNTALAKGYGGRQSVHADLAYNFPQFPCAVCANYYLEDASSANGSTELWLGSARNSTFSDHRVCRELRPGDDPYLPKKINVKSREEMAELDNFGVCDEPLEQRRAHAPPIQPSLKKGSVMLRDLRLWHAGIANPSSRHRIMLAFIHTPWWYKCPTPVVLPEGTKSMFDEWANRKENPIVYQTRFLPTEEDCRNLDFGVDFSSRNLGYWKMLPQGLAPGYTFSAD